jgi:hypothetical protein
VRYWAGLYSFRLPPGSYQLKGALDEPPPETETPNPHGGQCNEPRVHAAASTAVSADIGCINVASDS